MLETRQNAPKTVFLCFSVMALKTIKNTKKAQQTLKKQNPETNNDSGKVFQFLTEEISRQIVIVSQ